MLTRVIAATKSGSAYGDSMWVPEQGGVAAIGGTAWPPPNGADSDTRPYPTLFLTSHYRPLLIIPRCPRRRRRSRCMLEFSNTAVLHENFSVSRRYNFDRLHADKVEYWTVYNYATADDA
jgi:hypothetical protein